MKPEQVNANRLRIDRYLWHIRLLKSRTMAQGLIEQGHIRLNGIRVVKTAATVQVGDVITLPVRDRVLTLEILAIPLRRGPAAEAQGCYRLR